MKKDRLVIRKSHIAIFILFFCIITSVTVAGDLPVLGKVVYVDNTNTLGPWQGTLEYPYQHIMEGVDAADPGDTVYVFSGQYGENVLIKQTINLEGECRDTTIIDGGGRGEVINIFAEKVSVSGFTIQNSGGSPTNIYAGVRINANQITIRGNVISQNWNGIQAYYSRNHFIADNDITQNANDGIQFNAIQTSFITENAITANENNGVTLRNSSSSVYDNIIMFNQNDGIALSSSTESYIQDNEISNNRRYGVFLSQSRNNNIYVNNFLKNEVLHAYFIDSRNSWYGNYWDTWSYRLPMPIQGIRTIIFFQVPWLNFDRQPAQEPYDIGGGLS